MHAPQTDSTTAVRPFVGLPVGHYRAIAVDPPSHFKARTALQVQNWNSRRDVEKHYRTMSFERSSGPFIPQALRLIEAWGFRFSTRAFIWVKLRRALGSAQLRLAMRFTEQDLYVGL